jgi:hypothetical protein
MDLLTVAQSSTFTTTRLRVRRASRGPTRWQKRGSIGGGRPPRTELRRGSRRRWPVLKPGDLGDADDEDLVLALRDQQPRPDEARGP